MNMKPMLSMDVIKKYIDNIDEIKLNSDLAKYDKQKMTTEELKIYIKNYKMITDELGTLDDSVGGARRNN